MSKASYPELSGRVVLITGAARGIGAAIARAFAAQHATLALWDVDDSAMTGTIAECNRLGAKARGFGCDIRNSFDVGTAVTQLISDLGCIDVLINNAGVCHDGVVWKLSDEDWQTVIDTNLTGSFHLIRAVAPHMRERKFGRIINIASINGLRGKFGQSNYAASKAGVIGLTKSVAKELGRDGITVNAVAPGYIETDMTAGVPMDVKENAKRETVLGRLGSPDDIAATVLFLSSDSARHITGEVLKVDSGQYI